MYDQDILVSIVCATYNHEKYIRTALDSFLSQNTDFCYEVLVHDDASTDNTADILREYEKKYPEIIKPIYQTENQYSKGVRISLDILVPKARGKYIAFCEGDDFWVSTEKLQKQADYMESHPNCSLCICNAHICDINGRFYDSITPVKESAIIPPETVITGGGGFCATSSIFTRTELLRHLPPYFSILSIDLVLQMYLASCGETYCFSEKMTAYRCGVSNSWSDRMAESPEKYLVHLQKAIDVRVAFNEYSNHKYDKAVQLMILQVEFEMLYIKEDFAALSSKRFRPVYQLIGYRKRLLVFVRRHMPFVYTLHQKVRYFRSH